MSQYIKTKYHGPTNKRSSRMSAEANPGRIYLPLGGELDERANHAAAAIAYCAKYGWRGKLASGSLSDGDYVFVFIHDNEVITV